VTLIDTLAFHFVAPVSLPAGVTLDSVGCTRVTGHFRLNQ